MIAAALAHAEEGVEGLRLTMPAARRRHLALMLPATLVSSASAAVILAPAAGIALALLSAVVIGTVAAMKQDVTVGGGRLVIRDGVGFLVSTRTFDAAEVRDLRAENSAFVPERIRFEHGGRTHGFGGALDPGEAERLAPRIREALR